MLTVHRIENLQPLARVNAAELEMVATVSRLREGGYELRYSAEHACLACFMTGLSLAAPTLAGYVHCE